jgi:carboxylesterase type B
VVAELGLADAPRARAARGRGRAAARRAVRGADAAPPTNGFFYAPVVDGETLVTPPARAFAQGFARELPLVIGTTRDEMHLYFAGVPEGRRRRGRR